MDEDLLREIVEIAGEVNADRILRKTHAAAKRLVLNHEVSFIIDDELGVNASNLDNLSFEEKKRSSNYSPNPLRLPYVTH